ncbi:NAD(P)/FAD-dependent oxidoreductase [Galbibacter sp. EGI 63066]|uniref:FAD-dependent oxidoreductase n=1 Tax=Galbibacter sp. EGI 63066 TaxID=2993559 RepID=UPI002248A9DF|nr:NAD(P)/FAD-dependent oxidoreductase [Galbibacter sp. EGI 63066]MCX2681174.1 NAD(P)/FAD-dependent oxidoreductase [Galbibacter sp. EGI 63066]
MQTPKRIAITGSGLVGTLLAIYLQKKGHQVDVYDRRPDIRTMQFSGRSINLAMSTRGWKALEGVGIDKSIREIAIPMDKRAIHVPNKPMYFQYYGKEGEAIYSISRGVLNKKMIDLAEDVGARFIFNSKVWDVDLPEAVIYTGESQKGEWTAHKYDLVFGADGAFSRIRHKMQRSSMFNYSQYFLKTGYKELSIPAGEGGKHKLNKNSLHIWPRGAFMLIALPNLDGSFTCTLFMPMKGENSFDSLDTEAKVGCFFEEHFNGVKDDIPNLIRDFFKNPTSALMTIKCEPWVYWDKVALIGDAAHAVVPFYGQGMNAGFEDIMVLSQLMEKYGDDWEMIFSTYQKERKPNTDAVAELSYRNFIEMSSKTADERFLLRKKIEKWFSEKHPGKWLPLYSRVTFSDDSYAEALREGDLQNEIMDEVMEVDDIGKKWNSEEVENIILKGLSEKKCKS